MQLSKVFWEIESELEIVHQGSKISLHVLNLCEVVFLISEDLQFLYLVMRIANNNHNLHHFQR